MTIRPHSVLALLLLGCAPSARAQLGDAAHYAPAFAGYVVGSGADTIILRDPVTYEKLRCREDLERVAAAVTAAAEDEVHDRHARTVADVALGPFTLVGRAATMVGTGAIFPAVAITEASLTPTRRDRYTRARDHFVAGRLDIAREGFMGALLAEDGIDAFPLPWIERSVYYVGVCDDALQRTRAAADELRWFLRIGSTPDEERYRDAERRLARLDPKVVAPCRSQAPLSMAWRTKP